MISSNVQLTQQLQLDLLLWVATVLITCLAALITWLILKRSTQNIT